MPRHLIPKRSGVHRVACFGVYRALLRQSSLLPLAEQQRSTLRHSIQKTFRKHVNLDSPKRTTVVLRAGYDALDLLEKATKGDARLVSRIKNLISALPIPPSPVSTLEASTLPKPPRGPRVWPFPGAAKVLSRPNPGPLSGRRHVPKLVYANAIPILRFKKPQSPFLSRIIRDKAKKYQKWVLEAQELGVRLKEMRQEDLWDSIVQEVCGRNASVGNENDEPSWAAEVMRAIEGANRRLGEEKERRARMAERMYRILVEERRLAHEEKVQRGREKKQSRGLTKAEEAVETGSLG